MLAYNSQDFFDITFCYFPISFKPPPNDPYGITAEDLKSALRKCMAASPYFAKLALPLFLEKYATAVGQSMVGPFVFCVSQHALKSARRI
jgi:DNA repair/transcription protein MET18/MMS19